MAFAGDGDSGRSIDKVNGSISVTSDVPPTSVKMWQAANPTARDFREETIGKNRWTSTKVLPVNGAYTSHLDVPAKGWAAFFIQLSWGDPTDETTPAFSASTPVLVVPDNVYPDPAQ